MTDDKTEESLEACQETVEELKTENVELREAEETFGELAERLNRALRSELSQQAGLSDDTKPDTGVPECPRCGKARYVHSMPPSNRGDTLHCDYCGNSWQ
jgi:hypothetical protein